MITSPSLSRRSRNSSRRIQLNEPLLTGQEETFRDLKGTLAPENNKYAAVALSLLFAVGVWWFFGAAINAEIQEHLGIGFNGAQRDVTNLQMDKLTHASQLESTVALMVVRITPDDFNSKQELHAMLQRWQIWDSENSHKHLLIVSTLNEVANACLLYTSPSPRD